MDKKLQIRNSTTDFLVFTKQNGEGGIEVRAHDEDVWLTQKSMAQLFDCSTGNISLHLKNIFASGELSWATKVLKTFTVQGYVLDKKRLENGQIFDEEYFEHLLDEIREFFAMVQNKLYYAIHRHTAAEVIVERADHRKEHMGLTIWKNVPTGKIVKADVSIAKNYLMKGEMQDLNQFVTMYLDYAERQAGRQIPMTMEDWMYFLSLMKKRY